MKKFHVFNFCCLTEQQNFTTTETFEIMVDERAINQGKDYIIWITFVSLSESAGLC